MKKIVYITSILLFASITFFVLSSLHIIPTLSWTRELWQKEETMHSPMTFMEDDNSGCFYLTNWMKISSNTSTVPVSNQIRRQTYSYHYEKIGTPWYKELLEMIEDCFKQGGWMIAIGVILIVSILFVVGLTVKLLYDGIKYALNYWWIEVRRGQGIIKDMDFTPAHTTTTFISVYNGQTSTTVPMNIHHPDDYSLDIEVVSERQRGDISVSKKFYESAKVGDRFTVEYKIGRLDHVIKIVNIVS